MINWRQQRRIRAFVVTMCSYTILWIIFMGIIEWIQTKSFFVNEPNLLFTALGFGAGMGLFMSFYSKFIYIEKSSLSETLTIIEKLGFTVSRKLKNGTTIHSRIADQAWRFSETIEVFKGQDAIEIKTVAKYNQYLRQKLE